uniref:Lipase n=1 Tax=Syphacia muris TaxID=451379 RepID=A0A158R4F3_9BILA
MMISGLILSGVYRTSRFFSIGFSFALFTVAEPNLFYCNLGIFKAPIREYLFNGGTYVIHYLLENLVLLSVTMLCSCLSRKASVSRQLNIMELLFITLLLVASVEAELSSSFREFITAKYGKQMAAQLNRDDLGKAGSFGGGNHTAGLKTRNQPIILVHGVLTTAYSYTKMSEYFLSHGYTTAEVYATTWGNGLDDELMSVSLDCNYVRQIRNFIKAVSAYTGSKVDILAYSMGSPLSRKAILGQRCVDTKKYLGGPLTKLVDTFVGVAGANYGSFLCEVFQASGICNRVNGLSCNSSFLTDINFRKVLHYEGEHVFVIFSKDDDIVGGYACGHNMSSIPKADDTFVVMMSLAFYNLLLLFLFAIPSVDSTLGHSFYKWITETYGEQIARRFNRGDLGKGGSFGGGCHVAGTKTKQVSRKEPIILVNGLLTTADSFGTNWEYLLKHGYTKEEIYATTWGDGSFENIAWVPLSCKFVKQIRQFIEAVHNFTNSKVDVLAYSMGSPLTRKAILGGECVETKEDLGPPITDLIDTYVSVAGANFGVSLCDDFGECDTCSKLNGLDCESQFLEDINTKRYYRQRKMRQKRFVRSECRCIL